MIFKDLFSHYLKDFPENIKMDDLKEFMRHNTFIQTLKKYFMREPTFTEKLTGAVESSWHNVGDYFKNLFKTDESLFWSSDLYKNTLKNLGLDKKTELTKEDVRNFLISLIGEDIIKGKYKNIFDKVFEDFLKNLPDKIKLSDLKTYLLHTKFIGTVLKNFVSEPTIWDNLRYSIGISWMNISDFFKKNFHDGRNILGFCNLQRNFEDPRTRQET